MTTKFDDLCSKLREIFQIDKPELDFGIYRIINMRAKEINEFLSGALKARVQATLNAGIQAEIAAKQKELEDTVKNLQAAEVNPDENPKVKRLRGEIASAEADSVARENLVYTHLLTFFSRYYEDGDFISKRRYKGDVYAIPYAGEEVKLHWANADQYYTKSGENFTNYDFKLSDGKKVHFKLLSAAIAKDNVKDAEAKRLFALWSKADADAVNIAADEAESDADEGVPAVPRAPECPVEEKDGELYIYFKYTKFPKNAKQEPLLVEAEKVILDVLKEKSLIAKYNLAALAPTEKDKKRTLLKRELTRYTEKNTSDYFIHKDLKGFLTRELDFYIKNEMMNLDDVQNAVAFENIEKNLRVIQTVRAIASELIGFMAEIENFQKRLWLKKKFVVSCDYCLTLDRVPEKLRDQVFANEAQLAEWKKLGLPTDRGNGSVTEGAEVGHLFSFSGGGIDARMVDTQFFDAQFKAELLRSIDDIDETCDGVIIHSENFQALNLLQERYREQIKCIYIDPPYNTGNDNDFIYKDSYQHSSWASCLFDRSSLAKSVLRPFSGIFVSTDDGEYANLKFILGDVFGYENFVTDIIWNSRKSVSNDALISTATNHTTFYTKSKMVLESQKDRFRIPIEEDGFSNPDNDPRGAWKLDPMDAPNVRVNLSYKIVNPVTGQGFYPPRGRHWRFEESQMLKYMNEGRILFGRTGKGKPGFKRFLAEAKGKGAVVTTLWDDVKTTTDATKMLLELFSDSVPKTYIDKIKPKPIQLICRIQKLFSDKSLTILDYFGGSGTTAHATIALNREDGGKRKYILVEMGEHFNTVLKPRIEKVVYSPDWKAGTPVSGDKGISHCFKYMRLESYEDALDNIALENGNPDGLFKEEYLLKYMMRNDSRKSFLSSDDFKKPFDYKLKVAVDSAGASEERKIDLPETFNYLIGLRVAGTDMHLEEGYMLIEGKTPKGDNALVVWRDVEKADNVALNALLAKKGINAGDSEYDVIYVNGDHAVQNLTLGADENGKKLKVQQIETVFIEKMFEEAK